jgi:TonB-dependent receptor
VPRDSKIYSYVTGGHSQVDALPSINLQIIPLPEQLPGLKVRLAASQGIARPTFAQINPKGSASGSYVGTYQSYFNGNQGDPNLKPEKAEQFDASIEYYFQNGGMFHFSPFYKQIHNYIATGVTTESMTLDTYVAGGTTGSGAAGCAAVQAVINNPTAASLAGLIGAYCPQTVSVVMVKPVNEKETATVKGFEVGISKYLDFVPEPFNGFGVEANYTYIDSTQPGALSYDMKGNKINGLPMVGLSKNTVNLALMFDKQPISIRLAYNWRDDFLITTAAYQTTGQYDYSRVTGAASTNVVHYSLPVFQYPMGTLDANLALSLTDDIQWTFQASNLTKTVARVYMGTGDQKVNRSWYTADTRYTSQIRVKF